MHLPLRVAWSLLALAVFCPAFQVRAEDEFEVLKNLKDYDSIFESGFTVTSTRQSTDNLIRGRLFINVTRKWRLCFEGERVGYVMEVVDYEKPTYVPLKQLKEGEALSLGVRTRQWGYWGHDLSGNHYEDTVLQISPDGQIKETGKMHNSSVFGPRDDGPVAPRRVALWSLGRFYSKQLDEITKSEKSTDGKLLVTAMGKKGDGESGRWDLEIEPDAAWMVRSAKFYRNNADERLEMEMKNAGISWSGPHCIPQTAEINHWGPLGTARKEPSGWCLNRLSRNLTNSCTRARSSRLPTTRLPL